MVYAGTPDFAVPALERLHADGHRIAAVYTQPDRPAGRGRRPRPSPVKLWAEQAGLPVRQPRSLRDGAEQAALRALAADVMVVAAYGLILPEAVLAIPRRGCLNIHASLLPRWRGAAPIQRAIQAGDAETGACIMRMAPALDAGPVLGCRATPIAGDDTAGSVHDRLAALGAELLADVLPRWIAGTAKPRPQDEARVTYAHKLSRNEARLDWSRPAAELARAVRAFDPFPVAWTRHREADLRVWSATAVADRGDAAPGGVLAVGPAGVDVATGDGVLRLTVLQAPGRRRQPAAVFLNGYPILAGERLY